MEFKFVLVSYRRYFLVSKIQKSKKKKKRRHLLKTSFYENPGLKMRN